MNIKFQKNDMTKETHEQFTDDLIALGWEVVKDEGKPKRTKKEKGDDNSA